MAALVMAERQLCGCGCGQRRSKTKDPSAWDIGRFKCFAGAAIEMNREADRKEFEGNPERLFGLHYFVKSGPYLDGEDPDPST